MSFWRAYSTATQRLGLFGLAFASWAAANGSASADMASAQLVWHRPSHSMCPSAATLESDVELLLGRPAFSHEADADVLIEGTIEDTDMGVYVRIEAHAADGTELGTRELRAPAGECAGLRRPLGLVLTLLFERDADSPSASDARAHPWRVGALLAAQSGTLPRITPGVGLTAAVGLLPRLALLGEASYWMPVSIETSAGLGARFQAFSATLGLCPQLTRATRPVALSACLGGVLGGLVAAPRRLEGDSPRTRLLAQAVLTLRLAGRVHRSLALEGALGPALSLTRPRYFLTRSDGRALDVHRPALFGAFLSLTLFFLPKSS